MECSALNGTFFITSLLPRDHIEEGREGLEEPGLGDDKKEVVSGFQTKQGSCT